MSTVKDNNKRIAKNTLLLYFRMILVMFVTLYTSRVVLNVLGVEDYGIYNVVGGVVAMMGVLNNAMSIATNRYLSFELGSNNYRRLKQVFCTCMNIYLILSIIFVLLGETLGVWFVNNKLVIPDERMIAANWVFQSTLISVIFSFLANPYNAIIISHERMNIFAYIGILEVVLKLGSVYLLLVVQQDKLIMYAILNLIVTFFITMLYRIYCLRNFSESRFGFYWDKKLFKELLAYSGWNLFGAASGIVKTQGLSILLNLFFGPIVNTARGISAQIYSALNQFCANFYTAVRPQIIKYYASGDLESMYSLINRSSKLSYYLLLLLSMPIMIRTHYIIDIWLKQVPEYAGMFTRLIIITGIIDSMANPLMTAAHASGRIKLYQFSVGTLIIMNLPISYLLLKYTDSPPYIVYYVSILLALIALFMRLFIDRWLIKLPVRKFMTEVIAKVILVTGIAYLLPFWINRYLPEDFLGFIVESLICFISCLLTIYLVGFTKNESQFIKKTITSKLGFNK